MRTTVVIVAIVAAVVLFVSLPRTAAAPGASSVFTAKESAWLSEFTPRTRPMVEAVLLGLKAARIPYFLGEAHRPHAKSDAMHAAWKAGKGARAAPGGESAHNWREGWDINVIGADGKVPPDVTHPLWQSYGAIVKRAGAVWGGDFRGEPDGPHGEHPKWRDLKTGDLAV